MSHRYKKAFCLSKALEKENISFSNSHFISFLPHKVKMPSCEEEWKEILNTSRTIKFCISQKIEE